jgi:sugar transferase (PEP-CTERM/EpsH1 system associated)
MAKRRLLLLTQRIPYPPDKGEKIRYWPLLQHLAQSWEVHLGCLIDERADDQYQPVVRALCADAYFARIDPRLSKILCMRGLLSGEPLSVAYFRNRALAAWVDGVLARIKPEVIMVCSSNMTPYVAVRGATRLVVDLVDVDSEKWRAYAAVGGFPMRIVYEREWKLTADLESRIARQADACSFVSSTEAALFTRLLPWAAARTHAVPNGVDHAYFDPSLGWPAPFDTARANYVFTGTMDYPPNVDAVLWFAAEVLPLIRAVRPDAMLHIVGRSPAAAVARLAAPGRVIVTGTVADVRPYLAHANAAVAPLRIARGIQNKVLEAMAMARPVVVSSAGLEGIDADPGREVLLADDAQDFAQACLRALTPEAAAIGRAARARAVAEYGWPQRMAGFDPLLGAA